MTAEEFLKNMKATPKASKIEPFGDDIVKLRQAGASYSQILEFLRVNEVVVTYSSLADWMRRHLPPELLAPPKKQPTKKPEPSQQAIPPKPSNTDTGPTPSAPSYFDKKRKPEVNLDFLNED